LSKSQAHHSNKIKGEFLYSFSNNSRPLPACLDGEAVSVEAVAATDGGSSIAKKSKLAGMVEVGAARPGRGEAVVAGPESKRKSATLVVVEEEEEDDGGGGRGGPG